MPVPLINTTNLTNSNTPYDVIFAGNQITGEVIGIMFMLGFIVAVFFSLNSRFRTSSSLFATFFSASLLGTLFTITGLFSGAYLLMLITITAFSGAYIMSERS